MRVEELEGAGAVEVVGVADRERAVDPVGRTEDGVGRPPGLQAVRGGEEAVWQAVGVL